MSIVGIVFCCSPQANKIAGAGTRLWLLCIAWWEDILRCEPIWESDDATSPSVRTQCVSYFMIVDELRQIKKKWYTIQFVCDSFAQFKFSVWYYIWYKAKNTSKSEQLLSMTSAQLLDFFVVCSTQLQERSSIPFCVRARAIECHIKVAMASMPWTICAFVLLLSCRLFI